MKRKWLGVGIILLFIGVSVAPSINHSVVKASQDDNLVEVTTQACGIQGYGDTTVKLTREQYQNLEQYLVDFRARLNQTSTREEAVPIFKEAVMELSKYGLLPKGMSVEQAQNLIIDKPFCQNKIISQFEKLISHSKNNNSNQNFLCLVTGKTTNTIMKNPVWELGKIITFSIMLLLSPLYVIYVILLFLSLVFFPPLAILLASFLALGSLIANFFGGINELITINPIRLLSTVDFGSRYGDNYYPSSGVLQTIGLNGVNIWNGSFFGGFLRRHIDIFGMWSFPGITGFTGLSLVTDILDWKDLFFIGSALWVKIDG